MAKDKEIVESLGGSLNNFFLFFSKKNEHVENFIESDVGEELRC